ncbi:FAD-binding oxidoreductase [Sphingomonas vulcanisoli]|nr:FAD-binding oxidoreductase [Sphingomonas vulcanisoli]
MLAMPPCAPGVPIEAAAVRALRDALGSENVLIDDAVAGHVDPYSFMGPETVAPAGVALPGDVAEVQAILRIATDHAIPLWPVSAGRNYAYGGASPRVAGSLVVDLRRMNRILSVDEECAVAVLEPGVTFMQLHARLRATRSRLMPSVPDIGWGSVIGNALERGFGYTPYGDHAAQLCGLDVVLPTGELVHTGMAAKAGSPAAHLYKGGYGPSVEGLYLQSSFGIVTQAGVWMMPRPAAAAACSVQVPRSDDLAALVDALRPLLIDGTIQSNAVIGNAAIVAAAIGERADFCEADVPIDDDRIARVMERFHVGYWNARFGLYGTQALVDARLAAVRAAVSAVPGAVLDVRTYPGDIDPAAVHPADRAQLGIPSLDMVRVAAWRGGQPAHTDFSLVLPPTGREIAVAARAIRREVEAQGFDYAGGFTLFPRHAIGLALVAFDREDDRHRPAVRTLLPRLFDAADAMGAAPYRSHTAFMDLIATQYDAGDRALWRLTSRLKDAIDPAGIMAPGKQGIWPTGRSPSN